MDQKAPNILEKAAVSNMIGLLGQLNDLSNYAVEIFGDILKQTDVQCKRVAECRTRIRSLEEQVPGIEKRLVDNAPSYFYDNPYMDKEYARKDRPKGFLFRRDRSTIEVNRRRGLADSPPDLSLMDRFSPSGPCIKLFSDSEFFLNEWLEAEKARVEEEKRRRKAKKAERKAKREAREKKGKGKSEGGKRKIERVKKKIYSEYGAEYQDDVQQRSDFVEYDERTIPTTQSTYDSVTATDHGAAGAGAGKRHSTKVASPAQSGAALATRTVAPASTAAPTAKVSAAGAGAVAAPVSVASAVPHSAPSAAMPPAVPAAGVGGPPPVTASMATGGPPALPPGSGATMASAAAAVPALHIDPASVTLDPSDWTPEMRIAESRRKAAEQQARDEARRAAIEAKKEEAAKLVPTSPSASLMAAIRDGTTLKRAAPVKRVIEKDSRTMMLESIAGGARGLRKVDRAAEEAKRAAAREAEEEDNTIFAALNARRGLLADDSDDDSDLESSGWSDDD